MLVLSRHRDESIKIGHDVEVTIVDIRGDKVRLGIDAPRDLPVHRAEVYAAILAQGREITSSAAPVCDAAALVKSPRAGKLIEINRELLAAGEAMLRAAELATEAESEIKTGLESRIMAYRRVLASERDQIDEMIYQAETVGK